MKIIGLIPARRNSKRLPGKNMVLLKGKHLLQYTINAAKKSEIFDQIIVSSNWDVCLDLAKLNGIEALVRPEIISRDDSHDYEWVNHIFRFYDADIFMILRPTNPFRTADTIKRAIQEFFENPDCDSMRAVQEIKNHPQKMWKVLGTRMFPYIEKRYYEFPGYDMPTQLFENLFVQNGCIHIAWKRTLDNYHNISGNVIAPFYTKDYEGFDINTPDDLEFAEWLIERGKVKI